MTSMISMAIRANPIIRAKEPLKDLRKRRRIRRLLMRI